MSLVLSQIWANLKQNARTPSSSTKNLSPATSIDLSWSTFKKANRTIMHSSSLLRKWDLENIFVLLSLLPTSAPLMRRRTLLRCGTSELVRWSRNSKSWKTILLALEDTMSGTIPRSFSKIERLKIRCNSRLLLKRMEKDLNLRGQTRA